MNKKRKSDIKGIIRMLVTLNNNLQNILDDEEDYYSNIPENLLTSLRADDSENAIDELTDAIEEINQAIESLNNI